MKWPLSNEAMMKSRYKNGIFMILTQFVKIVF